MQGKPVENLYTGAFVAAILKAAVKTDASILCVYARNKQEFAFLLYFISSCLHAMYIKYWL